MPHLLCRDRFLPLSLAIALLLSICMPIAGTFASTNLVSGDTGVISGANGDTIRLRSKPGTDSAIVAEFSEGTELDIIDGPTEGADGTFWYRVAIQGSVGYVAADFVTLAGSEPTTADPVAPTVEPTVAPTQESTEPDAAPVAAPAVTGSATIVNTGGDAIRCRSSATIDGQILALLEEGATIELTGDARDGWQPVRCDSQPGWISSEFIGLAAVPTPAPEVTTESDVTLASVITGTGTIVGTNGGGVHCRKKSTTASAIITDLADGSPITLRSGMRGAWQPVVCAGVNGYVWASFVSTASAPGTSDDEPQGDPVGGFSTGEVVMVSGTNGTGVRVRSKASTTAAVLTVMNEGANVTVRSGSTGVWVAVTAANLSGFIHRDFLTAATQDAPPAPTTHTTLVTGDHAIVTSALNFRSGSTFTSSVIAVAQEGIVVLITGKQINGFFPVTWNGQAGFIYGDYIEWTDADLSAPATNTGGDAGNGAAGRVGTAMVAIAETYLGYPYIHATAGPNSFDCSGFTYWITKQVIGTDIGRGLWTQIASGTPVSYGNLRPGDLVFFQNTYTWGLSHVGIYIGNNQFIHAENEQTGVRISSILSTYYSTRFYGAVRLG